MFQSARVGCYPAHISYPDLLAAPLLISPRLCMVLLEKSAHFLLGLRTPLSGGAIVIDGTNPGAIFCAGLLFTAQFDAAVGAGGPAMRVVISGTV